MQPSKEAAFYFAFWQIFWYLFQISMEIN